MKEKLTNALGGIGGILWFIISILYCLAPLLILRFPAWVDFLLILAIQSVPMAGEIIRLVLFIWAFVIAVTTTIDIVSILFFVFFAIYVVTTLIPFISALLASFRESK